MYSRLLLSLFILIVTCSCGKAPSTSATLKVTTAFTVTSPAGGLMLYLRNKDLATTTAIKVPSTQHTIPLANGNWDFSVVFWDGVNPMTGNMLCGKTSMLLTGDTEIVNIAASAANCDSNNFSPASLRFGGTTRPLTFFNCKTFGSVTAAGTNCDTTNRGFIGSYKIKLQEYSHQPQLNSEGLNSECITAAAAPSSQNTTTFKVPYGSPAEKFATIIETFSSNNCTGERRSIHFPNGLGYAAADSEASILHPFTTRADLYLRHELLSLKATSSFGQYVLNDPVVTIPYTLKNFSNATATIASLSTLANPFLNSDNCGSTLAPGATCTVTVTFDPTNAQGVYTQDLTVSYYVNVADPLMTIKPLKGIISGPAVLTISNTGHDFGSNFTTAPATTQTFTVTNSGGFSATNVTVNGNDANFTIQSTTCGAPLAPAGSCTFVVAYLPLSGGLHTNTLTVSYNDSSATVNTTNIVSGTGQEVANILISGGNSFGSVTVTTTNTLTLVLTNTSTTNAANTLSLVGIPSEFYFDGGFPGIGGTCSSFSIPAGTCTAVLSFTPSSATSFSANIQFNFQNGLGPSTSNVFTVSGIGTP